MVTKTMVIMQYGSDDIYIYIHIYIYVCILAGMVVLSMRMTVANSLLISSWCCG